MFWVTLALEHVPRKLKQTAKLFYKKVISVWILDTSQMNVLDKNWRKLFARQGGNGNPEPANQSYLSCLE